MNRCDQCGAEFPSTAPACEYCGSPNPNAPRQPAPPPQHHPPSGGYQGGPPPQAHPGQYGHGYPPPQKKSKTPAIAATGVLGCIGLFGLLCGLGGLGASAQKQEEEAGVKSAKVVTVEEAAKFEGLACIEGVSPKVDKPLQIPNKGSKALHLVHEKERSWKTMKRSGRKGRKRETTESESKSDTKTVESFKVGELVVKPKNAKFEGITDMHSKTRHEGKYTITDTWRGIPADQTVTVVGEIKGGVMQSGDPFLITTAKSKKELVKDLDQQAQGTAAVGVVGIIVGIICLLAALGVLVAGVFRS